MDEVKETEVNEANNPGSMLQPTMLKSQSNTGLSWAGLPFIVQQLILRELADDGDDYGKPRDTKHRATCAAVCFEWKEYFESITFGKLVLHPSALAEFEKIIQRRQRGEHARKGDSVRPGKRQKLAAQVTSPATPYCTMPRIKHIWLRIELLSYDCSKCKVPEDGKEIIRCVFRAEGILRYGMPLTYTGTT